MADLLPPPTITTGTAVDYVSQRFSLASDYATELWALAQNLLAQLGNVQLDIDWDPVALEPAPDFGLSGVNPVKPTIPDIDDVTITEPEFGYVPPDPVQNTLPSRISPAYNVTDPGFDIPDAPLVSWPTFTGTAPVPGEAVIPEAPTVNLPPVPSIAALVIPSPPDFNIPEFNFDLPVTDLTDPSVTFNYSEEEYTSLIRDKLKDVLLTNLTNGGTGLNEVTEQAIYDRAVSRQRDEEQDAYDKILNAFAGYGYILPPGMLAANLLEIQNKILKTREDLNRDILIQQSKLAQENTHFIITNAIGFEKTLMDHFNMVKNRALDAAKFVVLSALEIYKAKVEKYRTQLEVYKAQTAVYTARIQGEIAKAEFYKAQIQGVIASAEVQRTMVEVYKAQVSATAMLIELFKSQMESAKIRAEIDHVRVQAFAASVQAYSAQVAATTARYEGYNAQIRGEVAKAEMYKAQVEAYTGRVAAYRTEVEADTMVLKQAIAINENQIEVFKARVQEYLARVQAAVSRGEIAAKNEGLKIDAFKAEVSGYTEELSALSKVYLGKVEEARASAEIELKEADIIVKEAIARQELIQGNIRAAAAVASQMAAAAISGVNASANVGFSESRSDARALTNQNIASNADNKNISNVTEHIYQHSD